MVINSCGKHELSVSKNRSLNNTFACKYISMSVCTHVLDNGRIAKRDRGEIIALFSSATQNYSFHTWILCWKKQQCFWIHHFSLLMSQESHCSLQNIHGLKVCKIAQTFTGMDSGIEIPNPFNMNMNCTLSLNLTFCFVRKEQDKL